jgi:hypothetical protein
LSDSSKRVVSENFYVVSDKLATFDWDKSTFFFTPSPTFADYRALDQIAKGMVTARIRWVNPTRAEVHLVNPGKTVAFFVHAQLVQKNSDGACSGLLERQLHFAAACRKPNSDGRSSFEEQRRQRPSCGRVECRSDQSQAIAIVLDELRVLRLSAMSHKLKLANL